MSLFVVVNFVEVPEDVELLHLAIDQVLIGIGDVSLVQVLETHNVGIRIDLGKVRHLGHKGRRQTELLESN